MRFALLIPAEPSYPLTLLGLSDHTSVLGPCENWRCTHVAGLDVDWRGFPVLLLVPGPVLHAPYVMIHLIVTSASGTGILISILEMRIPRQGILLPCVSQTTTLSNTDLGFELRTSSLTPCGRATLHVSARGCWILLSQSGQAPSYLDAIRWSGPAWITPMACDSMVQFSSQRLLSIRTWELHGVLSTSHCVS